MNTESTRLSDGKGEFISETSSNSLSSIKKMEGKIKDINYILLSVILILIVMVATLIIDSFHINSATYREYSEKINTLNILQDQNKELLEQNKENQELILQQQRQLIEFLKEQ